MIWLTWRQFRPQAWVALAILALIAVVFAITGPNLASMYNASGIATCAAHGDCGSLSSAFRAKVIGSGSDIVYNIFRGLLFAVPALIGVFWGAPLVTRELESGTFRLAWSQSVTRNRWTLVKLSLIGLASMALAALISLALTWWSSPIERVSMQRMTPGEFGATGTVPIGYAAFAFALGVVAGVLIRRTVPAMATTLALVVAAQASMGLWVRSRLIPPVRLDAPLNLVGLSHFDVSNVTRSFTVYPQTPNIPPGAWILSFARTITTPAHVVTQACVQELNRNAATDPACIASLVKLHLRQAVTYQPLSRYWTFQGYETAIFLALAVGLAGFGFWRIRSHLG